jgi:nucleoside permease NupC
MIAALRSELRKIVTLRSTYVIFGFAVLLVLFMDGWVMGYKHTQLGATFVADVISSTLMGTGFLLGLIVLLQITQEYRHNTIYYTLTLVRRRTTVF